MERLRTYIKSITAFSDKSWDILLPALDVYSFKKGEYLLKEGSISNAVFFICMGYCRSFHMKDGREVNTAFYFENDFATNMKSLSDGSRSEYSIMAVEKLEAVRLDKTGLLEAYRKSQEIEAFGRKLLELVATGQEEQLNLFKLMTAPERYAYIQRNQPEILQRVSISQISSYLGVSRETISRIRGKIRKL